MASQQLFRFKQFEIDQSECAMKVGTDGVLLGAWSAVSDVKEVLDIGTGTGIIALMLAQRSKANISAVEIDQVSFNQAKTNFEKSKWADRLSIEMTSIQNFAQTNSTQFDVIVCNPPFFSGGTLSSNQDKNNVRHTVKLSHTDLLKSARSLLSPTGQFSVILPLLEGLRFIEIAATYGMYCTRKTEVKPKADKNVERLLLEFRKKESKTQQSQLVIQNEGRNDWTEEYISLTKGFHPNL